jgi:hypothetical protein
VLVAPLLARGYQPALTGAAVIVALAASLAVLLRLRSPRHLLPAPAASRVATHDQSTPREGTRSCAG